MKHLRRIFAAVATLAGAVLALTTAPAAFAHPLPPADCCTSGTATGVTLITGGGMPGWQITLIAVGPRCSPPPSRCSWTGPGPRAGRRSRWPPKPCTLANGTVRKRHRDTEALK